MKILTLNTWGGRAGNKDLLNFFLCQKYSIDIFCLQEMWSAPYAHGSDEDFSVAGYNGKEHNSKVLTDGVQKISNILDNYKNIFNPHHLDNYFISVIIYLWKNTKI